MSEQFGSSSSVKILEWLTQYKRLSSRAAESLNEFETKTLKELESKLAVILTGTSPQDAGRRQQLRVPSHYNIQLSTAHDFKRAYITNISGGGLYIETENLSSMGSIVTIELLLPKETEPFSIKAEVAWINPKKTTGTPQGFGVKFVELSEKNRSKIQKLVNQSLERELKKKTDGKEMKS